MRFCYALDEAGCRQLETLAVEPEVGFEIRLDTFRTEPNPEEIRERTTKPLLATFRTEAHLGSGSAEYRNDQGWTWKLRCLNAGFEYVDLELDEPDLLGKIAQIHRAGGKAILSHHENIPGADLETAFHKAKETDADAIKLIGMGRDTKDLSTQREFYRQTDRPLIHFFMGAEFAATRVLSLVYGAPFTFVTLQTSTALAPGILTHGFATKLRLAEINAKGLDLFAVIGSPIGHSRSPVYHNPKLKAKQPNSLFLGLPCQTADDLSLLLHTFPELRGLAVTKPMKEIAFHHACKHGHTDDQELGAINTLLLKRNTVEGANTDYLAMLEMLRGFPATSRIRVLGYGGLGKAVVRACRTLGFYVDVCNRSPERVAGLKSRIPVIAWRDRASEGPTVIVQATSLGMAPHEERIPLPSLPKSATTIIETIYEPEHTGLTRIAESDGRTVVYGKTLFEKQAAIQNHLFLKTLEKRV